MVGALIVLIFNDLDTPVEIVLGILWSALISITQWLGHTYLQIKISQKIDWLEQPLKRFVVTVVAVVLYSVIAFILVQSLMNYIVMGSIPDYIKSFEFEYWIFPVKISAFIALVFSAIGFFKHWKNEALEKEKMKSEMLSFKYEALRNQINPHFMFNSLNVLADLVYEDQNQIVD